jgi:cytochrome b6-f complex iron-sulfur subunit
VLFISRILGKKGITLTKNAGNSAGDATPEISAAALAADQALDSDRIETRRTFFSTCGDLAMIGGLAASYGTLGIFALKFLSPDPVDQNLDWQFVATLKSLEGIDSYEYTASSGVKIVIARASDVAETGFLALSSVCPHLGCQVFWEAAKDRFFCPCHNGAFNASGKATAGPPAEANQSLTQYPTKILNEALYVMAPLETVTTTARGGA